MSPSSPSSSLINHSATTPACNTRSRVNPVTGAFLQVIHHSVETIHKGKRLIRENNQRIRRCSQTIHENNQRIQENSQIICGERYHMLDKATQTFLKANNETLQRLNQSILKTIDWFQERNKNIQESNEEFKQSAGDFYESIRMRQNTLAPLGPTTTAMLQTYDNSIQYFNNGSVVICQIAKDVFLTYENLRKDAERTQKVADDRVEADRTRKER